MSDQRYAANTSVPPDRSRAEIERTLTRYGANSFMYGWDKNRAALGFVAHARQVRFILPMPDRNDPAYRRTATGRPRKESAAREAWEQDTRQSWRALALVIKAKLEAVASGIVTFEDEFAMHMVLPDGRTVAEHVRPAIAEAYETGQVPQLLPAYARQLEGRS